MINCLQNFFYLHQWLLRRWELCGSFNSLLEQLLKFVIKPILQFLSSGELFAKLLAYDDKNPHLQGDKCK